MYDKANIAFERLQELALEHAIQFGVTQQSALMEIVNLSNAWLYEESIERRLERHNTATEVLTRQVVQIESGEIIPHESLCVSWLEQDGGADRFYDTHCI